MQAVSVETISKTYDKGRVQALEGVSFTVKEGELFGLIGPDGAGKTTLFRILATLLLADRGNASVGGLDVVRDFRKIRQVTGYMPGRFSLYQDLTVRENLEFFATVFGTTIEQNYDLIKDIYQQIQPFDHRRAGQLSGGMKQKLALCCALIHQPRILLLDEPTTGVDVVSRKEFWEMLKGLKHRGITILVSTPYMDEAMRCERIALIQKGVVFTVDTPQAIIGGYEGPLYAARASRPYALMQALRKTPEVRDCFGFGDALHFTLHDPEAPYPDQLLRRLQQDGHSDLEIQLIQPGIEDCFIRLMQDTPAAGKWSS